MGQYNPGARIIVDKKFLNQMVESLVGLPVDDARRLIKGAIADDGALSQSDLSTIMQAKFILLDQGGVLSFEYDTAKFADVGGLEGLKQWLQFRREIFSGEIQNPGLDTPKGIMLLGVKGCGKSLVAKSLAGT